MIENGRKQVEKMISNRGEKKTPYKREEMEKMIANSRRRQKRRKIDRKQRRGGKMIENERGEKDSQCGNKEKERERKKRSAS